VAVQPRGEGAVMDNEGNDFGRWISDELAWEHHQTYRTGGPPKNGPFD
jgi:hypothetical protein